MTTIPSYTTRAYPFLHPAALNAVAHLAGRKPPEQRRYLEIGCGSGWNLIPLAARDPEGVYIGFDIDGAAIAEGNAAIAQLQSDGVLGDNVKLLVGDIADRDLIFLADAHHTHVVAHGVYSWLPPEAKEALLPLIQCALHSQGVGFISYNCMPGWAINLTIAQALRAFPDDVEALLEAFSDPLDPRASPKRHALHYAIGLIREEIKRQPDYLHHEYLNPYTSATWATAFAMDANAADLVVLGDAHGHMWNRDDPQIPAKVRALIREQNNNPNAMDTLRDFALMESFRRTVIGPQDYEGPRSTGVPELHVVGAFAQVGEDTYREALTRQTFTVTPGSPAADLVEALIATPQGVLAGVNNGAAVSLVLQRLARFRDGPEDFALEGMIDPYVTACLEHGYPVAARTHYAVEDPALLKRLRKGDAHDPVLAQCGFLVEEA